MISLNPSSERSSREIAFRKYPIRILNSGKSLLRRRTGAGAVMLRICARRRLARIATSFQLLTAAWKNSDNWSTGTSEALPVSPNTTKAFLNLLARFVARSWAACRLSSIRLASSSADPLTLVAVTAPRLVRWSKSNEPASIARALPIPWEVRFRSSGTCSLRSMPMSTFNRIWSL